MNLELEGRVIYVTGGSSGIPMKRFGTPEEVAPMVTLLLSPLSSYITATSVDVAGEVKCQIVKVWYLWNRNEN